MLFQFTSCNLFQPYLTFCSKNTLYKLPCTHFKGEQSNWCWFSWVHDSIARKVQCKCCFTNRRTCSKDDQIRILPSIGDTIQTGKSTRNTCHIFILMTEVLDTL